MNRPSYYYYIGKDKTKYKCIHNYKCGRSRGDKFILISNYGKLLVCNKERVKELINSKDSDIINLTLSSNDKVYSKRITKSDAKSIDKVEKATNRLLSSIINELEKQFESDVDNIEVDDDYSLAFSGKIRGLYKKNKYILNVVYTLRTSVKGIDFSIHLSKSGNDNKQYIMLEKYSRYITDRFTDNVVEIIGYFKRIIDDEIKKGELECMNR